MLSFKQICNKVFPNKQLSPNAVCAPAHTFGYVHTVNHRNTLALMATREQCLLISIASGGFFGQQDFRDAYRVPTVQEGHAQCNQTLPTLEEKTRSSFAEPSENPLNAPHCPQCTAVLFAVLISILSPLCSYCFGFVVCFFYLTLRRNSLKTTTPFQSYSTPHNAGQ